MEPLIAQLTKDYPFLNFTKSKQFKWSPDTKTVHYSIQDDSKQIALLHEVGHAIHEHQDFESDLDLIQKELQAWDKAEDLAPKYNVEVDDDFIEECMETYRNWLHQRSLCPKCQHSTFQGEEFKFKCHNCQNEWQVEQDQYCGI